MGTTWTRVRVKVVREWRHNMNWRQLKIFHELERQGWDMTNPEFTSLVNDREWLMWAGTGTEG